DGALSDPRVATLPIVAATGGVLVPALLYVLINSDPAARRGWAIPTATDIAFAVGVLSLIGRGIPPALRLVLLTLAIIDDIAAMPLFALANAGVSLQGLDLSGAAPLAVGAGIVSGLVLGKPIGIVLASIAAVRLKLCVLPAGVHWRHVVLVGLLGGIGFTMSIFI